MTFFRSTETTPCEMFNQHLEEVATLGRNRVRKISKLCCLFAVVIALFTYFFFPNSGATSKMRHPSKYWALHPPRTISSCDDVLNWIFAHVSTSNHVLFAIGENLPTASLPSWEKRNIPSLSDFTSLKSSFPRHRIDLVLVHLLSNDCIVFQSLACDASIHPQVMIVQYNSNYPLESTLANLGSDSEGIPYAHEDDRLFGCGLGALLLVAQECGYGVVYILEHSVYLVSDDARNFSPVHNAEYWRNFTLLEVGKPSDFDLSQFLCDYNDYKQVGNFCRGPSVLNQVEQLGLNFF